MKKQNFNKTRVLLLLMLGFSLSSYAQITNDTHEATGDKREKKIKKAWEIGIGASGLQMTRFNIINFSPNAKNGHFIDISKKDLLFGGHLYVARELNSYFYLDMQGMLNYCSDPVRGGHESRWVGMAGLGLQWRLGKYFHSSYIDPFLRAGMNYMYKNFRIEYNGLERFNREEMKWNLSNDFNKEGHDRRHLFPASLGAGVNMWLNDRVGIGLEADYLLMPNKQIANAWQGSVRLMWRIGGRSKRPNTPRCVEKIVERIVEKPVIVEKIVEKPVIVEKIVKVPLKVTLSELFNNIHFDFDSSVITDQSSVVIDEIAHIMLQDTNKLYLITGCCDAKGSPQYNMVLSKKRADAVVEALIKRGYPAKNLKTRGVGKTISCVSRDVEDEVRRGDRKIMIEMITNKKYWNYLPK